MAAKRKKLPRAERAEENRRAIFRAAAKVVGAVGYKAASIARITQAAGLAQGTFYLYFESRQDLFDKLLPEAGNNILEYLSKNARPQKDILDAEREWLRALLQYFMKNPGFFTILNEAEFASKSAHRAHMANIVRVYNRTLSYYSHQQQIAGWSKRQIELISVILIAARAYLYQYYLASKRTSGSIPDEILDTYVAFLQHGIRGPGFAAIANRDTPAERDDPAGTHQSRSRSGQVSSGRRLR